jgi:hypothetical protein
MEKTEKCFFSGKQKNVFLLGFSWKTEICFQARKQKNVFCGKH